MTIDIKGVGRITASRHTINNIIILMHDSADYLTVRAERYEERERKGDVELGELSGEPMSVVCRNCAKHKWNASTEAYNALEATGYYGRKEN